MAYEKTTWVSGETALSADNMNNIEDGIAEIDNNLGKVIQVNDTTVSVPTGSTSDTVLQTVTLQPGQYILVAMVRYEANANGMRAISVSTQDTMQLPHFVSQNASDSGSTSIQMTRLIDASVPATLRIIGRQTSNSSLSATTHLSILQLK